VATNYPEDFDTLYNPLSSQTQDSPSHAQIHADANDAIEAIELELGATPSGGHASVSSRLDAEAAKTHLNPVGTWAAGTEYALNDLVRYRGYTYQVTTAHTSGTSFNSANFEQITSQGPTPPQVSSLKIAGHSYMDPNGIGVAANQCTGARIKAMLGLLPTQVQNIAISGGVIRWHDGTCTYQTVLQNVNPGIVDAPRVADAGIVFTMWGTNDATVFYRTDNWDEWTFKEAYKTVIARYRAASVYENTDTTTIAYTGSWTARTYESIGGDPWGSGTGFHYTNSPGAKVTITTPSDMGRYQDGVWVDLGFIGGYEGATADIYLDGVYHGTLNNGRGAAYGTAFGTNYSTSSGQTYHQKTGMIYRMWIPTVPTTSGTSGRDSSLTTTSLVEQHEIEIRYTGAVVGTVPQGDATLKFDYWQIEADEPPLVLVSNMIQPPNGSWVWAALQDPDVHDIINDWIQTVVDWFNDPTVRLVDNDTPLGGTTATWTVNSNAKWFSKDGLHPNAEGAKVIAETTLEEIVAALNEGVSSRNLLGFWSDEVTPKVDLPVWDSGAGDPLIITDDFERAADATDIGGTGWTPVTGGWGIDDYGQAYLVSTKFTNPDFVDEFDRDDSTSVVDNGWTQTSGTWGINGEQLYLTANGASNKNMLIRDANSTTHCAQILFAAHTSSLAADLGIIVRCQDANNWLMVVPNTTFGGYAVYKCVGGVITRVSAAAETDVLTGAGYGIRVEVGDDDVMRFYQVHDGTKIVAYGLRATYTYTIVDAVLQHTNANAKYIGIGGPNQTITTTTRLDNFKYGTTISPNIATYNCKQNLVVRNLGSPDVAVGTKFGDDGSGVAENWQGLVLRYQDPDNFYALLASVSYGAWAFSKCVNGTFTTLKTFLGTNAVGTVVSVSMDGPSFSFYLNGSLMTTATDATYLTGNSHGIALHTQINDDYNGARWADFRDGAFQLDSEYGNYYVDNGLDPSTVTLFGPYNKDGDGWGTGVDISTRALRNPITTVTADAATPSEYVVDISESIILVDTTSTGKSIILPDPSLYEGRMYTVKKITADANSVIVDCYSGNIDNAATPSQKTWSTPYAAFSFVSDGTNWWIV
jgi:hypothetical protein